MFGSIEPQSNKRNPSTQKPKRLPQAQPAFGSRTFGALVVSDSTTAKENGDKQIDVSVVSNAAASSKEVILHPSKLINHKLRKVYVPKSLLQGRRNCTDQIVVTLSVSQSGSSSSQIIVSEYTSCDCGCVKSTCNNRIAVSSALYNEIESEDAKIINIQFTGDLTIPTCRNLVLRAHSSEPNSLSSVLAVKTSIRGKIVYQGMKFASTTVYGTHDLEVISCDSINDSKFAKVPVSELFEFTIENSAGAQPKLPERPKSKDYFSCIGGHSKIKEILMNSVIKPVIYGHKFLSTTGEYIGVKLCKGTLLYGVPGTGKTYFCDAIQDYLERLDYEVLYKNEDRHFAYPPFIRRVASGSLSTPAAVVELFSKAHQDFLKYRKLTVLMLDELDAICCKRDSDEYSRVELTNSLLSCMDGPLAHASTFIIATTNRPDDIDEAVRRPGRIDREIEMPVPSTSDKVEILEKLLLQNSVTDTWARDHSILLEIAKRCSGFVPSDLQMLIRHAADEVCSNNLDGNLTPSHLLDATKKVYPSALKELSFAIPETTWNDIGGYNSTKQLLKESVEWPITHSDLFRKYGISPSKGVLLYGPPGNSKTLLAKAIAGESAMNFITIKGPEVFSMWVGESERKVREIFRKARLYAPTIIFIDEIDAIGLSRNHGDGQSNAVEARVLSQLLNEMDGICENGDVIVIGATNRPTDLDPALVRPGRLDKLVYVGLPDSEAREKIFALKGIPINEQLIKNSEGYSGAELTMYCDQSKMSILACEIEKKSVDTSVDLILLEQLAKNKPRTSKSLIAYFEDYNSKLGS